MTVYRIQLALRSPLGTPLVADTLFGHLCWGIVYHEGQAALRDFLAAMDNDDPPLVISDPLPTSYWPMPVLPSPLSAEIDEVVAKLDWGNLDVVTRRDRSRELLRRSWVPNESWLGLSSSLSSQSVIEALAASEAPQAAEPIAASVPHNTIHRLSGQSLEEGGLHFDRQFFPPAPLGYDVWARTSLTAERLQDLFEWGLESGYGRDGSAGKGHLTVEEVSPCELPTTNDANAVMALGVFAPRRSDPTNGLWNLEIRQGKLGGAFATSTSDDQAGVFKYPVVLLRRGAILLANKPTPTLGRMVRNVHPTRPEIVTYAQTLTLPVRLSQEARQCLDTK